MVECWFWLQLGSSVSQHGCVPAVVDVKIFLKSLAKRDRSREERVGHSAVRARGFQDRIGVTSLRAT
jgi:hypothetical protein